MYSGDFGVQFDLGPDDVRLEKGANVYYVRIVDPGESLAGIGVSGFEGMVAAVFVAIGALTVNLFSPHARGENSKLKVGVVRLSRDGVGSVRVIHKERVDRTVALQRAAELGEAVRSGTIQ